MFTRGGYDDWYEGTSSQMEIVHRSDGWYVLRDGETIAGPFSTREAARRFIDDSR